MNNAANYQCYEVRKSDSDEISSSVVTRRIESLPHVEAPSVRIRVGYSALNYKDAMAANSACEAPEAQRRAEQSRRAAGQASALLRRPILPGRTALRALLH